MARRPTTFGWAREPRSERCFGRLCCCGAVCGCPSYARRVRYLSVEWFETANAAVQAAADQAPEGRVVVDQTILSPGEPPLTYRVTIARGQTEIIREPPTTEPADAHFEQQAATAAAIVRGETDAHQAFLLGHIRFRGDIAVLIEQRAAFEWLEATLAPVLAKTTF